MVPSPDVVPDAGEDDAGADVVDVGGATSAEVAVEAALAVIEGATALRSGHPRAARRAATVVAAIGGAPPPAVRSDGGGR